MTAMDNNMHLKTRNRTMNKIFMRNSTHLLAYNSVNSSTVPDLLLSHHNWPLLFSEDHESIQWFFDIRMVFIRLVEGLCVTAKKQTNTNMNCMFH